jgi:hypothetical protein
MWAFEEGPSLRRYVVERTDRRSDSGPLCALGLFLSSCECSSTICARVEGWEVQRESRSFESSAWCPTPSIW